MIACDLIVSLVSPARLADALHLAGLLYGVLGLVLRGWHKLAQPEGRRSYGIVAVPGPCFGFALVALGLALQALALAVGACR